MCHMLQQATGDRRQATASATDLHPTESPTIQGRLIQGDPQIQQQKNIVQAFYDKNGLLVL